MNFTHISNRTYHFSKIRRSGWSVIKKKNVYGANNRQKKTTIGRGFPGLLILSHWNPVGHTLGGTAVKVIRIEKLIYPKEKTSHYLGRTWGFFQKEPHIAQEGPNVVVCVPENINDLWTLVLLFLNCCSKSLQHSRDLLYASSNPVIFSSQEKWA